MKILVIEDLKASGDVLLAKAHGTSLATDGSQAVIGAPGFGGRNSTFYSKRP